MSISKTAAMELARARSWMFRQGREWVVATIEEEGDAPYHRYLTSFKVARNEVAELRAEEALILLGYENPDTGLCSLRIPESGSLEDRVNGALRGVK